MTRGLEIGFQLDHLWHALRGEMDTSKRATLVALARVLAETATPYAVIGGIALQVHRAEPRTTLDIDLAVPRLDMIPGDTLLSSGFRRRGRFAHSENWLGPDGVPVQFTEDPALQSALQRASAVELDGVQLRVIGRSDLLHEKLRAGSDPAGRRSKRLQDLVDAQGLVEEEPALRSELSESEQMLLDSLPT